MKKIFAILLVVSFSANAYEIFTAKAPVPVEVQDAIRAEFDHSCYSLIRDIKSLEIEKFEMREESVDQGYLDHIYTLSFSIHYVDNRNSRFTDRLYVSVVKPIQDRSGRLDAFVRDFRTEYGGDGDSICNQ